MDDHNSTSGTKSLHDQIEAIVKDIGITGKYIGYAYVIYAVELVLADPTILRMITKKLYPMVAEHFGCRPYNVERSIRTVARVAWERNRSKLQQISSYDLDRRPTCTDLIDLICCRVRTPDREEN